MSTISVQCSACGQRYKVQPQLAGKGVKCQKCGAGMKVPLTQPERAPEPALTPADNGLWDEISSGSASQSDPLAAGSLGAGTKLRTPRKKFKGAGAGISIQPGKLIAAFGALALVVMLGVGLMIAINSTGRQVTRGDGKPGVPEGFNDADWNLTGSKNKSSQKSMSAAEQKQLAQEMVQVLEERRDILRSVTDQASAQAAVSRLEANATRTLELEPRIREASRSQDSETGKLLQKEIEPKLKSAAQEIQRELTRISRVPGAAAPIRDALQAASSRRIAGAGQPGQRQPGQAPEWKPDPAQTVTFVFQGLQQNESKDVGLLFTAALEATKPSGFGSKGTFSPAEARIEVSGLTSVRELLDNIEWAAVEVADPNQRQIRMSVIRPLPSGVERLTQTHLNELERASDVEGRRRAIGRLTNNRDLDGSLVAPALARYLDVPELKKPVLVALKGIMTPEQVPAVIEASQSGDKDDRIEALRTLSSTPDPGPEVIKALATVFEIHPWEAENVFKEIGAPAEPIVLEYLKHPNPDVRICAIKTLALIGTELSLQPLERMQSDPDKDVAKEAKNFLDVLKRRLQQA